jgi:hypothetical protein
MNEEWKQMQDIWAETNPGGPDVDEILAYVVKRAEKFDRKIRWRNRREWISGVVGLAVLAGFMSLFESTVEIAFGISMAVLVAGLDVHRWLMGRSEGKVDPSLSRPRYRAAMEEKYGKQIRMVRNAMYWFLIPVLVTGGTTAWSQLNGSPGGRDLYYFSMTLVVAALAWWANNIAGVKAIRGEWEKVRRALDDGERG